MRSLFSLQSHRTLNNSTTPLIQKRRSLEALDLPCTLTPLDSLRYDQLTRTSTLIRLYGKSTLIQPPQSTQETARNIPVDSLPTFSSTSSLIDSSLRTLSNREIFYSDLSCSPFRTPRLDVHESCNLPQDTFITFLDSGSFSESRPLLRHPPSTVNVTESTFKSFLVRQTESMFKRFLMFCVFPATTVHILYNILVFRRDTYLNT
jgi:hypothetical protein